MSDLKNKGLRKRLRILILTFVGIIAFTGCILTNIIGMSQVINKESDRSGLVGFSVIKKSTDSSGSKKETKVDDEGKIVESDILVNALPMIKLNNNSWDRLKSGFSGYESDENGNMIFPNGYILYCNERQVNNIVFDNTYTGEIIGHLKVGEDFKTIEKNLGVPTFKTKTYLGYKTKEDYVFFYENEVSVYPNMNVSNKSVEDFFESYLNKTYNKERTYFLVDIRNNYKDFIIEMDEETNTVILTSLLRQMVVKLDSQGGIEVELYNGYKIANESTKEYIKKKIYLTNEEDLVEIVENERVSGR